MSSNFALRTVIGITRTRASCGWEVPLQQLDRPRCFRDLCNEEYGKDSRPNRYPKHTIMSVPRWVNRKVRHPAVCQGWVTEDHPHQTQNCDATGISTSLRTVFSIRENVFVVVDRCLSNHPLYKAGKYPELVRTTYSTSFCL